MIPPNCQPDKKYIRRGNFDIQSQSENFQNSIILALHHGPELEIMAGQQTMSGLIGELTGHIQSYWKWNKLKFPCCLVVTDIGVHILLDTKLKIFSLLLVKQWLLKFLEIYNASFGSWALVLGVIYLINLTSRKRYLTKLKWIRLVIVSRDSPEIISIPVVTVP